MTKWFNIRKYFSIMLVVLCTFFVASTSFANNYGYTGPGSSYDAYTQSQSSTTSSYTSEECPDTVDLQAKYGSGCWSCLIFEKLTSAFLHAAKKGLPITQKAGATLLWLGTALWFVFWALKNVSSFTQVQIGNILNDLLKFLLKAAIAYWFIVYGTAAINKYITTPILSVGALIGQQFWDDKVKDYVESWDTLTDEDTKLLEKELQQKTPEITTPIPQEAGSSAEQKLTEEEKAYDEEASKQNEQVFGETEIPNLLIPGLTGGTVTSLFGCRPSPCTGCSKSHKGIDAAIGGSNSRCNPVVAAGPGTIMYKVQRGEGNKVTGYGYYAIIDHGTIKGNSWKTYYAHMQMNSGSQAGTSKKVRQGEPIGCIGNTGVGTGAHLHFGVYFSGKVGDKKITDFVDPLSLPAKKICTISDSSCDGKTRKICQSSLIQKNPPSEAIKEGGWPAAGKAVATMSSVENFSGSSSSTADASLIPTIPDVKYTGPTDIMPKSIMNSMLGALFAITNTVSENMVLGDAIMCYAGLKNGGGWHFSLWKGSKLNFTITNFFMWLQGAIIWCLGFMLLMAVGYYFIDISFKIGFAVLALPLVMGLWPFGITQDKLFVVISIIAKGSACFAFMAVSTAFGMGLVSESLGGLDELYATMDGLDTGSSTRDESNTADAARKMVADKLQLFSMTFLMVLFSLMYFYKLVKNTCSDLVNKFFPDKAFGDSNPMHSGATMATSFVAKPFKKAASMVGDIAANQVGKLAHGALKGTLGTAVHAIRHPMRAGRAVGKGAKVVGVGAWKGTKAVGKGAVKGVKAVGHAFKNAIKGKKQQ